MSADLRNVPFKKHMTDKTLYGNVYVGYDGGYFISTLFETSKEADLDYPRVNAECVATAVPITIPVPPKKHVRWARVYIDGSLGGGIYKTKAEAQDPGKNDIRCVIPVEIDESKAE